MEGFFVRKVIFLLSFLVVFVVVYQKKHQYRNDLSQSPTERKVYYQIGTIDPRFHLTKDEAKALSLEAVQIWESTLGRHIFFYSPKAPFKINFIYDRRQQMTNARHQAERELADDDGRNQAASANFEQQKSSFEDEVRQHSDELNLLNARVAQHQQRVAFVNSHGGASLFEAQSLQIEGNQINRDVAAYNEYGMTLNIKQVNLNHQAEIIHSQVDVYNQQANSFTQKFTGHPFEVGIYKGYEINVYEFENKDYLRLVLAHELGHALGLEHNNDPHALMYPTVGEQDMANLRLMPADVDLYYGHIKSY